MVSLKLAVSLLSKVIISEDITMIIDNVIHRYTMVFKWQTNVQSSTMGLFCRNIILISLFH